jgi:hypothetical protein
LVLHIKERRYKTENKRAQALSNNNKKLRIKRRKEVTKFNAVTKAYCSNMIDVILSLVSDEACKIIMNCWM